MMTEMMTDDEMMKDEEMMIDVAHQIAYDEDPPEAVHTPRLRLITNLLLSWSETVVVHIHSQES